MNNGITHTTTTDTALTALKMALRDRLVTVDPAARRAARALVDLGVMAKPIIAVAALAVLLDDGLRALPAGRRVTAPNSYGFNLEHLVDLLGRNGGLPQDHA